MHVVVLVLLASVSAAPQVNFDKDFKIIGGQEATPHSIPYQVFLQISGYIGGWICSGTLISRNYVVTAANCLVEADRIQLTLGAHKPNEWEDTQVRMTSTFYKIHEDYFEGGIGNDIAVIKLPQSIELTAAIQPVKLPQNDGNDYAGALAIASGWGVTDPNGQYLPDALNYVQLPVITNSACQSYFGPQVSSSNLCTGPQKQAGLCSGDAGGPLVVNKALIGVAAFTSIQCTGSPSGFTRVTTFLTWLKVNTDV